MDREDLGALVGRVTRRLVGAETPLLAARGLSMWGYVVLSQLARRPAETQLALAQAIAYDKTRLIGLLGELEQQGLISRQADPADRRARTVRLTAAGQASQAAVRADIRALEARLLAGVSKADRRNFRAVLSRLAAGAESPAIRPQRADRVRSAS